MSQTYLYIFLQSNLIEVPFYYLFLRRLYSPLNSFGLITAINSLTHPLVFFILMNLKNTYLENILLAESFAVASEALFLFWICQLNWKTAFLASLVANLASWQMAPIFTYLFFRPN